jgi:MFS family permease
VRQVSGPRRQLRADRGGRRPGAAVGPGLAALVYAGLYAILPEAIAWRALFAVGILPALLVLWIRRSIPESEAFEGRRDSRAPPGLPTFSRRFAGGICG